MGFLARSPLGEFHGAAALARETQSPPNYLAKLLQQMSKHGLLTSQKGLGGGFRLARDPDDITLYDVIVSVGDLRGWERCMLGNPECSNEHPCGIHNYWEPVRVAFFAMLRETRVSDLNSADTGCDDR
jgi:Rrf2 family protein